ncbi:MAG: hypothetical protein AAF800_07310 [Planctomycetota bacterium]
MQDLDLSIRQWRQHWAGDTLNRSDLDELEDHLRQHAEPLMAKGISADDAVWVAARHVGAPAAVIAEYDSGNPVRVWSKRLQWMVWGFLAVTLLQQLVAFGVNLSSLVVAWAGASDIAILITAYVALAMGQVVFIALIIEMARGGQWVRRLPVEFIKRIDARRAWGTVVALLAAFTTYLFVRRVLPLDYAAPPSFPTFPEQLGAGLWVHWLLIAVFSFTAWSLMRKPSSHRLPVWMRWINYATTIITAASAYIAISLLASMPTVQLYRTISSESFGKITQYYAWQAWALPAVMFLILAILHRKRVSAA